MKLIYLLFAALLAGCCATGTYTKIVDSTWVQKIDAEELIRTVVRYTTKLNREKGLTFEDSRVYYTECNEKIRLVLASQRCPEICEARELLVDVVEGLLTAMNNNPSIRADLCHQPFTSDDVEIYISFSLTLTNMSIPFTWDTFLLTTGWLATIWQR